MKSKVLLAAVALTGSAIFSTANAAVALADLKTAPMVRISGATAPDNTFNGAFLLSPTATNPAAAAAAMFEDGTIVRFEGGVGPAANDNADFTITCGEPTAAALANVTDTGGFLDSNLAAASIAANEPICVQKVAHGSGQGTGNVGDSIPINFASLNDILDVNDAVVGCDPVQNIAASGDQQAYDLYDNCLVPDEDLVPDCGVADVEPALFPGTTPADYDSGSTIDIPWGLQVSLPLYFALQAVQFSDTACDPGYDSGGGVFPYFTAEADTTSGTGIDDINDGVRRDAECVPSLSSGVIRSIFTNDLLLADELRDDKGNPLRTSPFVTRVGNISGVTQDDGVQTDDPEVPTTKAIDATPGAGIVNPVPNANAGGNTLVYLCRRKSSSGTQASYEAKFLRQRCELPALQMTDGNMVGTFNDGNDDNNGFADFLGDNTLANVYENDGSSDVTQCMDQATVQNVWAIGINSTEKVSETESTQRDGWSHVRIDGVLPTSINVTKGYHPYFSSVAGNTRAGEDSLTTGIGAVQFCRGNVFDSASVAAVLAADLPKRVHGWGQGGALASATKVVNSLPVSDYADEAGDATDDGLGLSQEELALNPVNQFQLLSSGAVNNCAPPTKFASPGTGADIIPAGVGLNQ